MGGNVAPAQPQPVRIHVRMYQVGFGDCFLVSFEYAQEFEPGRRQRHMLFDFGSMEFPKTLGTLKSVAQAIAADCEGRLDMIVLSHRHKDHLSGFGQKESAAILSTLHPRLIVRPWTEDPEAAPDFPGETALDAGSRGFVANLAAMEVLAEEVVRNRQALGFSAAAQALVTAAETQVKNRKAVEQLNTWAEAGDDAYLFYGDAEGAAKIAAMLPGVGVRVLGPPTVAQHDRVKRDPRENDPEYWNLFRRVLPLAAGAQSSNGSVPGVGALPLRAAPVGELGPERWLIDRMRDRHSSSLLRIVRSMDDALNNTSVILLLTAGKVSMLFAGDAQIENWEYALRGVPEAQQNLDALAGVTFYKVGHHGSRNATPLTIWRLWEQRDRQQTPLTCLLSTRYGVYDRSHEGEVPNAKLVTALTANASPYFTSSGFAEGKHHVHLVAEPAVSGAFVEQT